MRKCAIVSVLLTSTTSRFFTHLFLFEWWLHWFLRGCFVPSTMAQATMKGRSWRYFSVFWLFMVAGLLKPAASTDCKMTMLDDRGVAPTAASAIRAAAGAAGLSSSASVSSSDTNEPCTDADCASGADEGIEDDEGFDAFLRLFCRTTGLGNFLFGNNVTDTTALREESIKLVEEEAKELTVHERQTMYKHTNTTKIHRRAQHLGDKMRARRHLWEGATSSIENPRDEQAID